MENIRKLVLLVMILGIIPIASIGTGIAEENNVVATNVLSTTTTFHGTDFLYIGDAANTGTVKQFDATTGKFIATFVSLGSGGLIGPMGILFDKNGNLLVANQNVDQPISGEILQYNGKTGAFKKELVPSTDENAPDAPHGMILKDSKLYVADMGDSGVPGNVSCLQRKRWKVPRDSHSKCYSRYTLPSSWDCIWSRW